MHQYITEQHQLQTLSLNWNGPIALDYETVGLHPRLGAKLRLIQLCDIDGKVAIIDAFKVNAAPVMRLLQHCLILGHNLVFEQKHTKANFGFYFDHISDTRRASEILYNGKGLKHDLFSVLWKELAVPEYGDYATSDWSGELSKEQLEYAEKDVTYLRFLESALATAVRRDGLETTMRIENAVTAAEAEMDENGFTLDTEQWKQTLETYKGYAEVAYSSLADRFPDSQTEMFGEKVPNFNPDSPKQLKMALKRLGIDVASTAKESLMQVDHPAISDILAYRKYKKRSGEFMRKYLDHVEEDGKIRSDLYPFLDTGRYSSSKPNLQQIPRDVPNEPSFRRCFTASPGYVLVIADYSQVQLRIIAEIAKDKRMIEIYNRDGDIHTETAKVMSQTENPTKTQRQAAKAINFGKGFGLGAKRLKINAKKEFGLEMTLREAEDYGYTYYRAYPGVGDWHYRARTQSAIATGECRTLSGRVRYMSPQDYNEFLNTPVQGTEADMIKSALGLFEKKTRDVARLVLTVHDEIIAECLPENVALVKQQLKGCMEQASEEFLHNVPSQADVKSGHNWSEK